MAKIHYDEQKRPFMYVNVSWVDKETGERKYGKTKSYNVVESRNGTQVCRKCWTVKAVNGSCSCY